MQKSLVEEDRLDWARDFLSTDIAKEKLMLPIDLVAAISFSEDALHQVCSVDSVPAGWMALDIGPQTINSFVSVIQAAATIFWNGPLGVFEMEPFAGGTFAIAQMCIRDRASPIIC